MDVAAHLPLRAVGPRSYPRLLSPNRRDWIGMKHDSWSSVAVQKPLPGSTHVVRCIKRLPAGFDTGNWLCPFPFFPTHEPPRSVCCALTMGPFFPTAQPRRGAAKSTKIPRRCCVYLRRVGYQRSLLPLRAEECPGWP